MESIIKYKEEMISMQNISFDERMNFIETLSKIEKDSTLDDISKTKKLYDLNFKLLEKLSRGKINAQSLYVEDAVICDDLVSQLQELMTSKLQKKN